MKIPPFRFLAVLLTVGLQAWPGVIAAEIKSARTLKEWDFSRATPFLYEFKNGKEERRENRTPEGIGTNVWSPRGAGIVSLSKEKGPGRNAVAMVNLDASKSTQVYTTGSGEIEVRPGRVYVVELKYSGEGRAAPTLNYRLRSLGETFEFENVVLEEVVATSGESPRELGQVIQLPVPKQGEVRTFRGGFRVVDGGATLSLVIYNAAQGERNPLYLHELSIGDAGPSKP